MGFIIKSLVTEKMTKITEKSSEDKKIITCSKKIGEANNAISETRSYVVSKKNFKEGSIRKEKKIYTYTKLARPKYGFIVKPEANKFDIKREIESLYEVTVIDVNTINYSGKRQSRYTRAGLIKGKKNAFKKVIVTLKNGDIIAFRTSDNYVVTHRIVETKDENGKRYFTTKGDNNKSNDMDPVAFDKIEGVYVTKYSKLGNFVLFIQKPIGFVVIMIIILLIGVILIIVTGKSKSRVISDDELKAFEEFKRNRNK